MPLTESNPDSLSKIYAQSLYELVSDKGGEEAIHGALEELEGVLELAREDARFSEFLASRVLAAADRAKSLETLFRGRMDDTTLNFLLVLNAKGRLSELPAIVAAFDETVQDAFGKVEVDVYTASPMSGEHMGQIKERLQAVIGREPVVHPYVDESMIGGVKMQIGDRLIDASLATRLRQLRERMATSGTNEIRAAAERMLDDA
ncbi:MAG: ATP synthase F1 subunit delta [Planctomycetota bacterium]